MPLFCAACGDNEEGLSAFYPPLPPSGGPTGATAGQVTDASQLLTGPAQSGLVGDFFIKNEQVSFIVQSPARVIGVIPQGGNLVDAALVSNGAQTTDDHFGELGLIYLFGRTCEPDRVEIVRDGADGGPAVLRAIGKSGNDDFLDIKGIGALPVDVTEDPVNEDGIACATTYVLAPGTNTIQVYHSLFNTGPDAINGPMGTIADTGGNTEAWTNARGFERADISALTSLSTPAPADYVVYQGPGVAYGVIPRHTTEVHHAQALVAGVSILLDGADSLLDLLNKQKYFLHLEKGQGLMQRYDVVVGKDGNAVEVAFRNGMNLKTITGKVAMADGSSIAGARVGFFADGNNNGVLDDADSVDAMHQPTDRVVTYTDVAADGTFTAQVPTTAGNLLARAEVKNVGRSPAAPVTDQLSFTVPSPIKVDFQIVDADTNQPIPGRLLVVGDHPAFPDKRLFETYDRLPGVVIQQHCIHGDSDADGALSLPAGGTYRIYASRGTEWSMDSAGVTASGKVTFKLKHVIATPNYYATDWHVHQIGSPDSNIPSDERIRSALSAGVEMFAVTDHDYVSDLQPLVEDMGMSDKLRVVPGIEVTPFAYGHFMTWPLEPDNDSANHGAIDWARGAGTGLAMTPGQVFDAMRARGGKMVQVNHPRSTGFGEFQAAFTRANVKYDFTNRTIYGDYANADVPNDYLRLPGESLWSDQFNGLEIWNGFDIEDADGDGLRENKSLDRVMRDWLSMLSMGLYVTPAGNSDTHTTVADPLGMPRTYVRVADDSAASLADGSAVDAVVQTQTGANQTPRDVVVTDGPFMDVTVKGMPALGRVVDGSGGVTVTVHVQSPDWAEFDTLEVFANSTPDPIGKDDNTALVPLKCWTSRTLAAKDPCALASLAAEPLTVTLANGRYETTLTVTLDASDIDTRQGATGKDAWLVFRARGNRAIFPIMARDAITDATQAAILSGDPAQLRTALVGVGVPAEAVTAPVFVDFDGGGYRAPFAP